MGKYSFLTKELLQEYYDELGSQAAIAEKCNIPLHRVKYYTRKLGVKMDPSGGKTKYIINEDIFSKDSEIGFYIAGFIAADGGVTHDSRSNTNHERQRHDRRHRRRHGLGQGGEQGCHVPEARGGIGRIHAVELDQPANVHLQGGRQPIFDVGRPRLPPRDQRVELAPVPLEDETDHLRHGVDTQRKLRGDTEVAASAAATCPEQIGVRDGIHAEDLARGRDDLDLEHVVTGQTKLSRRHAEAAAEREPAEPDGRSGRERCRHADLGQLLRALQHIRAGTDLRHAAVAVHADVVELAKINDQASVDEGIPLIAMPPAPGPQRHVIFSRPLDRIHDVRRVLAVHDGVRLDVETLVEVLPRVVPPRIPSVDHPAGQRGGHRRLLGTRPAGAPPPPRDGTCGRRVAPASRSRDRT